MGEIHEFRDVNLEARAVAVMSSRHLTVDPDGRAIVYAADIEPEDLIPPGSRTIEVSLVPRLSVVRGNRPHMWLGVIGVGDGRDSAGNALALRIPRPRHMNGFRKDDRTIEPLLILSATGGVTTKLPLA